MGSIPADIYPLLKESLGFFAERCLGRDTIVKASGVGFCQHLG